MTTASILALPATGLFVDRYRPTQRLGGGNFGEVWKADDTKTGRTVALKLINPLRTTEDMAWEEATRLTSLESPHLVRVHGAALAIDIPYIDMALAPGGSTKKQTTPYGIDQATAVRWAQQVARGLALCHTRRIVHRDIKPDNILLSGTSNALLGDFGAAAIMRADGTTDEHGDAEIRAPEAFGGFCTNVGDVYSLGATLFYFLTGRFPHSLAAHGGDLLAFEAAVKAGAPNVRDLAPHVSRTLGGVVTKALQVNPGQRYQSASEMDKALAGVKATTRKVREVIPHDPTGRCWDATPPAGRTAPQAVHVCATPAPANTLAVDVRFATSRNRIRQHCQTHTRYVSCRPGSALSSRTSADRYERPTVLKLLPGAPPGDAIASLRERALHAGNVLTAAHVGGGMLRAYLQYALEAVRMLDNHFVASDVRRLIQTQRYWSLQTSTDGVMVELIPAVVQEELTDQRRALEAAALHLESDHERWQRGRLVVPDTSALIHGPKLWDWDPAGELGFRDSAIHIVLPIQVLDELDDLKEATKQHTRNRARRTLNWLNATMGNQQSTRLRQGGLQEATDGPVMRGDVYLDVLLDDPGHQRLPIADDEIVDRAAAVEAVAGHAVTLVTNDHGQAYRAGFASIQVAMVNDPIYDVDEQEKARQVKADFKKQQRDQQARRREAQSPAKSPPIA